ncbi:MAG: hypothetical protein R3E66_17390 [bacterium]
MKVLWLVVFLGLLSCDTQHSEPTAWTLEPGAATAPIPRKVYPLQPSTEDPYLSSDLVYIFDVTDVFYVDEMPEPLRNLTKGFDSGIDTVWLRLPPQVLGHEAVFECPHPVAWEYHYSKVEVSPGVVVQCMVHPSTFRLYVSFINKRLATWDYSEPSLDIGMDPDHMLYRWRFVRTTDGNVQWFNYYYWWQPTDTSKYGGFRL